MIDKFLQKGKASFVLGGQYGSEGKGAAAAWTAAELLRHPDAGEGKAVRAFDVYTTNAGSQSGHTSIHKGIKKVVYHLPTAPLIAGSGIIYLNAGSIIDVQVLLKEIRDNFLILDKCQLFIHPNATVITDECKEAENRPDSAQTKIASTRKGVGEALSRKVLRSGLLARDCAELKPFVRRIYLDSRLQSGQSVLVEVPQGNSLSLNGPFYPHCTSRDCTVGQAMSDAGIHPSFVGPSMLVLRTYPIRVGNLYSGILSNVQEHSSGDCYPDQVETTWEALGVKPEITTVTGRVRRVFTWSQRQVIDAMIASRPEFVFLSHVDYLRGDDYDAKIAKYANKIYAAADVIHIKRPKIIMSAGPATIDVGEYRPELEVAK